MLNRLARAFAVLIALAVILGPAYAQAPSRPLTLDDVLSMEAFGSVSISPDGRYAAYERSGPYDQSPRFDRGHRSTWAITDLFIVDLHQAVPEPSRVPSETGAGLLLGPWSPDGRRLALFRFQGDTLELGVLRLSDRVIEWTGLVPDMPIAGGFLAWRDDGRLVVTARADGTLPWILDHDGAAQSRSARLWADMAGGAVATSQAVETRAGVAAADRPSPRLNLVEVDAATLEKRILTSGPILDFAISDDGARIALLKAGEGIPVSGGPARTDELNRRGRLTILDGSGVELPLRGAPLDVAPHLLRWSAASDALLVWGRRDGTTWAEGGLFRVAETGEVRPVSSAGLDPFPERKTVGTLRGVRADWLGEGVLLYARRGDDRFDWHFLDKDGPSRTVTSHLDAPPARLASVQNDSALLYGDGGLWRIEANGAHQRLAASTAPVLDATFHDVMKPLRLRFNQAPRRDWAFGSLQTGGVIATDITGRNRAFITDPLGGVSVVAAASRDAVLTLVRAQGSETLSLSRSDGVVVLDELNPALKHLRMPKAQPVAHIDRLGHRTTSWLYLPTDVPVSRLKGLVVMVYPGITYDGANLDSRVLLFSHRPELIAAEGYAVLSPAMPTDEAISEDPEVHVLSVDLAVDALFKMMPDLPRDRTAIFGHSFGGMTALNIAARSDRYQTYIASAAATDLAGVWGEFDPTSRLVPEEGLSLQFQMGWAETGQGTTGAPPWVEPERYVEVGPFFAADRIKDPVLLITGDRDFVPMSQSERMFTALHRRGVDARLVTHWGEGHTLWSPANIRANYAEIFRWLSRTLTGSDDAAVNDRVIAAVPKPAPIPPSSRPS